MFNEHLHWTPARSKPCPLTLHSTTCYAISVAGHSQQAAHSHISQKHCVQFQECFQRKKKKESFQNVKMRRCPIKLIFFWLLLKKPGDLATLGLPQLCKVGEQLPFPQGRSVQVYSESLPTPPLFYRCWRLQSLEFQAKLLTKHWVPSDSSIGIWDLKKGVYQHVRLSDESLPGKRFRAWIGQEQFYLPPYIWVYLCPHSVNRDAT